MDVALALDKDKGIAEGQGITALLEEKPVVAELARRPVTYKLDLIAAYLLRVHFFSYYGGDEAESEGDLLFTNVSQIACAEARAVIIRVSEARWCRWRVSPPPYSRACTSGRSPTRPLPHLRL